MAKQKIPEGAKIIDADVDKDKFIDVKGPGHDMAGAKVIDVKGPGHDMVGAKVIDIDEQLYERATSQCNVLRPVLQNPQCNDDTRKYVVDIIRNILNGFSDNDEHVKKLKEQIYLENPDFFPKESALVKAKKQVKKNIEKIKPEIQKRLQSKKPEDRISGVVAADKLVEGVKMGIIDKPKDIQSANRQNKNIRKRLGMRLLRKGREQ